MTQKPTLVILAAGMGSRYGGIKQLDEVGPNGEAIIDYSIYDAYRAGFGKVVFIIREDLEEAFNKRFAGKLEGKIPYEFAYQRMDDLPEGYAGKEANREKPWGTGHAIWCSRHIINEPFIAINADDFYGRQAYQVMHDALMQQSGDYYMVGYYLKNTVSEHGSVSRGICYADEKQHLTSVVEYTDIYKSGNQLLFKADGTEKALKPDNIVSMNIWGFQPDIFNHLTREFSRFLDKNPGPKAEFYIPTVVNELIQQGKKQVTILHSNNQWYGVTYREDRPVVQQAIREMIDEGLYPANLW